MERIILTSDGHWIMALSEQDKIKYEGRLLTEGRQGIETLIDSVIEKNKETQWGDLSEFERYIVTHSNSLLAIHWQELGTIWGLLNENIMFRVFVLNLEIEEVILIEKKENHILVKAKNEDRSSQYIRKYPQHPFKYESVVGMDCVFSQREDAKKYLMDYWKAKENSAIKDLIGIRRNLEIVSKL